MSGDVVSGGRPCPRSSALNGDDLRGRDTRTLLRQYAETLTILKERNVIRSRNAPAGDLAETLVMKAYHGRLAPASQKSWDVEVPDGTRLQVKSRLVAPNSRSSQIYSAFRSWDFDRCVFVLFDISSYDVLRATDVPVERVRSVARRSEWVAADRISLATDLMALEDARDVTDLLSAALTALN
ncbi:hypothetical protein QYM41_16430 [Kocuria sp. CPCC 205268]|uniref:hypothetical protein n=1 Tax=Kocuria oxytropis TaxID=3058913 RepID=UPI0034D48D1A